MKNRRIAIAITFLLVAFVTLAAPKNARADVSDALRQGLSTLRGLGPQSFNMVVQWSRNGAPQVPVPIRDYEQAEAQVLNLDGDDRFAVLTWLQGNGRGALYSRGATDDQIGPPRPGVDIGANPTPAPTPNPWRSLDLASLTLSSATPPSNIVVLGGFAAAKRDGTSAMACVSFRNVASIAATRVVFEFPLLSAAGDVLATLTLDRRGTFSPNVAINSYPTLGDRVDPQKQGLVPRGYADNCVQISNGIAAVPILSARHATYRVSHVEYADGSAWPRPTPSPSP